MHPAGDSLLHISRIHSPKKDFMHSFALLCPLPSCGLTIGVYIGEKRESTEETEVSKCPLKKDSKGVSENNIRVYQGWPSGAPYTGFSLTPEDGGTKSELVECISGICHVKSGE